MNLTTREEIVAAIRQGKTNGDAFWNQFDDAAFFRRFGDSWSPAETVRHLTKSTRPVVKALKMPRLVLWMLFGRSKRTPWSYEELISRYREKLAAGGQAGRFAPSAAPSRDRVAIMKASDEVLSELMRQVSRWPEAALDRLQLPHPLLGKLTVREMLFFTIYHHLHHRDVIERRASAAR